jgi:hypothetical protein
VPRKRRRASAMRQVTHSCSYCCGCCCPPA